MKDKKYLVTGGLGFIGSNLVDFLISKGHSVDVVDDLSSGFVENENSKATNFIGDVKLITTKLQEKKYDCVFHLAAEARIQPSFENPQLWMQTNVQGTVAVCEYARRHNTRVVLAGSSSCYGGKYKNPYTFSKKLSEEVCEMYSKIYGLSTVIARFFNVYGPRNPLIGEFTPVIAKFEQQMKKGLPLTVVGDGEQRRDFTHVQDICEGLYLMSKSDWKAEVFNLGTGKNYSLNEVAKMFSDNIKHIPARPGESKETLADTREANEKLGWRAKTILSDYVKEITNE